MSTLSTSSTMESSVSSMTCMSTGRTTGWKIFEQEVGAATAGVPASSDTGHNEAPITTGAAISSYIPQYSNATDKFQQGHRCIFAQHLGEAADRHLTAHYYTSDAIVQICHAWEKSVSHSADSPVDTFIDTLTASQMPELESRERALGISKQWSLVHLQKKQVRLKKTPAEKAAPKEARRKHVTTYNDALKAASAEVYDIAQWLHDQPGGHSVDYYYRGKNKSSAAYATEVSAIWKAMSKEEQVMAVQDALPKLQEQCAMWKYLRQNEELNAFHDICANIASVSHELDKLSQQTGAESVLITVHSDNSHFNLPIIHTTTEKAINFFELTFNKSLSEVAHKYEAFLLSGVEGIVRTAYKEQMNKKKHIVSMILTKLRAAAGREVPRVVYSNFNSAITQPYNIIVEHWPLPKFCGPHDIHDKFQLEILFNALETGTTVFRRLALHERVEWEQGHITSVTHAEGMQPMAATRAVGSTGLQSTLDPVLHHDHLSAATPTSSGTSTPVPFQPAVTPLPSQSFASTSLLDELIDPTLRQQPQSMPVAQVVSTGNGSAMIEFALSPLMLVSISSIPSTMPIVTRKRKEHLDKGPSAYISSNVDNTSGIGNNVNNASGISCNVDDASGISCNVDDASGISCNVDDAARHAYNVAVAAVASSDS
ncbi:hypothetical protein FISHEDRAFT_75843 [Fistulina hepatica ATCC 64428]|uniref:Uncharacterized protein n=1 Tax=Fistulina hepatica ATCC 64428 TaxID=1128425 RepID=A0A0D7A777_9AGAR|nr:hypothetical protein FISHEDRAFT_75843 [Fistulina hepatica ATCC 64428]